MQRDTSIPDVAVVGAGAVGLCCAYGLHQKGATVVLVDAAEVGAGASRGNVGWITPTLSAPLAAPGVISATLRRSIALRDPLALRPSLTPAVLHWLWRFRHQATQSRFRDGLRALLALASRADRELTNYRAQGVTFEMHETGLLVASIKRGGLEWLSRLLDELVRVGYDGALETLTGSEARDREPVLGPAVSAAVFAASDRLVRPESLCEGLAWYLRKCGVRVLTGRPVQGLRLERDHLVLDTSRGPIRARRSVLATGVDTTRLLRPLGCRLPIIGAKGYSITLAHAAPESMPRSALYLSEVKVGMSPYHDSLRVGGFFELGARSAAVAPRRIEQLMAAPRPYLKEWPSIRDPAAIEPWAGLRPATPDSLPFIGRVPGAQNLYIAAGHGMLGMTLAPATGALLADLITEGNSPAELLPLGIHRNAR